MPPGTFFRLCKMTIVSWPFHFTLSIQKAEVGYAVSGHRFKAHAHALGVVALVLACLSKDRLRHRRRQVRRRRTHLQPASHRPLTSPPVCNSLHHEVTGLRTAASATTHGLAAWLHHQAGWLAVSMVTPTSVTFVWLIMCKYDAIYKTGSR